VLVGLGVLAASTGVSTGNPRTLAQWHSATKAQLASLEKARIKPKTAWPPIPANTACRHPKIVKPGHLVVGFSGPGLDNSAVVQIAVTTEAYLQSSPEVKKVIAANAEENPSKQISDIQSMITQGINLLIADPATLAASPGFNLACQAGITVVTYDRFLTAGTGVTATMYADEIQDGYNEGQAIVKALHGHGNVIMIGGLPGIGVSSDRIAGGQLAFKGHPAIKVLGVAYSNYDIATAKTEMLEFLAKYPKIDAVWADSGIQSIGVIQALEETHRLNQIKMLTGGQLNEYLKAWSQAKFHGFGSTISMDVGFIAAQLGIDIATGKIPAPSKNIAAPLEVIDQAHLHDYVRPAFPDSYWATSLVPLSVLKQVFKAG
jgi:ribose transport system substrate-binding protein